MARATEGATGPAFGKSARMSETSGGASRPAARPARPAPARRIPRVVDTAVQFLKDVRSEMNRVAWPDRQTVIASSLVVVFVLVVTALYLAGWDLVLAEIFKQILKP